MFIAKVIGNLWATRKHKSLEAAKLLLVDPTDGATQELSGDPLMAVDKNIGAGIGDIVLVMDEGNSARQILKDDKAPVRAVICAIVDTITVGKKRIKCH